MSPPAGHSRTARGFSPAGVHYSGHVNSRSIYGAALAFALLSFAVIVLRYDALPAEIPVHIGPDGEVDREVPTSLASATFGAWYAVLILVLFFVASPRPSMAYRRVPVPDPSVPFSQTAADKAAALLEISQRALAWIALVTTVSMCLLQITFTFPGLASYRTAAGVLMGVSLFAAVIYTFVLTARWPQQLEAMPTDDDERARQKHFGAGTAMGFYNEPDDPMVTWVSPFNQGKVDLNWAHRPVKQYVFTVVALLVVVCVAPYIAL